MSADIRMLNMAANVLTDVMETHIKNMPAGEGVDAKDIEAVKYAVAVQLITGERNILIDTIVDALTDAVIADLLKRAARAN